MVRQNYNLHYKLISKWLKSSNNIVWRRQYTSKELHEIFIKEIDREEIVASRTFSLTLNKCATEFDCKTRFEKKEIKPRKFRFILYGADDNKSFLGNIKKNQRHRRTHGSIKTITDRNSTDSDMIMSDMIMSQERNESLDQSVSSKQVNQPSPQPSPQPLTQSQVNVSQPPPQPLPQPSPQPSLQPLSQPLSESNSIKIAKMKKSSFPMALAFFMGKYRAKSIQQQEESKIRENDANVIDYSKILTCHLQTQTKKLRNAFISYDGWKVVLDDSVDFDEVSVRDVFHYRIKCYYLYKLYKYSLKYYDSIKSFYDIASLALLDANKSFDLFDDVIGENDYSTIALISNPETILRWFCDFRDHDYFTNIKTKRSKSERLPPFLSNNPDVANSIISFCKENLSTISVETVHEHIMDNIIPKVVERIAKERGQSDYCKQMLFQENRLKKLTIATTYVWMCKLGFNYHPRKKCYYVDSHESDENIQYRKSFISRYFKYELRCYRWFSITKEEKDKLVSQGEIDASVGYHYTQNGIEMVEFHVDDHILFQSKCDVLPYGGNLSVRKPPNTKPLMLLGQDECIFKQYLFTAGYWMLPDGTKQLVPKDEGQGIMLSSFTCRELGYGMQLSKDVIDAVNLRRRGKKYSDVEAANARLGSATKNDLTSTPFVRSLDYGANTDGYWSYDHMIIQLEDCIDVLQYLHPEFDFMFIFDHSNGHDRLQSDGLSTSKINVKYGGKQPHMRCSELSSIHFGPFHNSEYLLQPGMKQSMVFSPNDAGPCYMSDTQREQHRYDIKTGKTREKDLTVAQLISNLKAMGIPDPKGLKPTLQALSERNGLPTKCNEEVVVEGWVNKPKGSFQVLFERGWINPAHLHLYTGDGRKEGDVRVGDHTDPTGCMFSIDKLMKLQHDFTHEITLLQLHAQKLGVSIDRSPKCHPELAGEGIEYLWALAKWHYRRSPIKSKRSKSKFVKLVNESTNPDTVLNIKRARACSKKARSYMKLYMALESLHLNADMVNQKHDIIERAMKIYSKMKRTSKTHRSVADKHLADVREIEQSISLDCTRNDLDGSSSSSVDRRMSEKNEGQEKKANVKKEIVTILLRKMEQLG